MEKSKKIKFFSLDSEGKTEYNRNMKKYEYKQTFAVKYRDVDFKDELRTSTALAYMEEVAGGSADELGFGYAYCKERGIAFMLSNVRCEFLRPVPLYAAVTVRTWPTPPTHVVFGREYQFLDENGTPYINATSRWCLIDMRTGKLVHSKTIDHQDYSTYNTDKLLEGVQWKIPTFPIAEGELKFRLKIANSEYDHNMHVNNTRYADYCFNCFSVEELSTIRVKSFGISYVRQCKEGEILSFYRKKTESGYLIEGLNESEEIVTQAQILY